MERNSVGLTLKDNPYLPEQSTAQQLIRSYNIFCPLGAFSYMGSNRTTNFMSMVLQFLQHPHCDSGSTTFATVIR